MSRSAGMNKTTPSLYRHLPPIDLEPATYIDALMAMPVKGQAAITVFGDDDVEGINPPPSPFKYDGEERRED
jgi:hypothetical protein